MKGAVFQTSEKTTQGRDRQPSIHPAIDRQEDFLKHPSSLIFG
jgi:hypothetical protein